MSRLLKHEDYWSIWIGGFFLITALLLFWMNREDGFENEAADIRRILLEEEQSTPFHTVEWHLANDQLEAMRGSRWYLGKQLSKLTIRPTTWKLNPIRAFAASPKPSDQMGEKIRSQLESAEREQADLYREAVRLEELAAVEGYTEPSLNENASIAIRNWRDATDRVVALQVQTSTARTNRLFPMLAWLSILAVLFGFALQFMGQKIRYFMPGWAFVATLAVISFLLGSQEAMKSMGIGYAAWAIALGLLISNTLGTPKWVQPALQTELYIKTGLVILGAEILMGKVLAIGLPGIFVAWVVTPTVLISTFWFGQRVLRIPSKTLNMTISADMSVCGVSAAVATAAACKATKEELTLAIGLSMTFTSIMMVLMPMFINWVGIPEVLGGAWIGGTIDATGAVVAAGAFLGEKALSVAATIKMIQNILIGVVAFGVAYYFTTRVHKENQTSTGVGEIWRRFPKFILGFLGASVAFSIFHAVLDADIAFLILEDGVIGSFSKNVRAWLFCLAFVSIGLSTRFSVLKKYFRGGKPLILYLTGQALNLGLTLLMAYIMFYLVFPEITNSL